VVEVVEQVGQAHKETLALLVVQVDLEQILVLS
jgi:hypothetical protein